MIDENRVKKAQEILLNVAFSIFKNNPKECFGPADITRELGLFRGLTENTAYKLGFSGTHNDRLAQALINELLNRDKIEKTERARKPYKLK